MQYEDAKEVDTKITSKSATDPTCTSNAVASVIRRAQNCFYYDDGLAFLDPNVIAKLAETVDEDDQVEFGEEELDRGFWLQNSKLVQEEADAVAAAAACVPEDPSKRKRGREHTRNLLNLIVPPKEWTSGGRENVATVCLQQSGHFRRLVETSDPARHVPEAV